MIKCNCGAPLIKGEMKCDGCGSDQIAKRGSFLWVLFGFIGGIFIPSLLDFIVVIFLNDKRVVEDFLNPTLLGRSRWAAIRKGIIFGAITKILLLIGLLILIICWSIGLVNGLGG